MNVFMLVIFIQKANCGTFSSSHIGILSNSFLNLQDLAEFLGDILLREFFTQITRNYYKKETNFTLDRICLKALMFVCLSYDFLIHLLSGSFCQGTPSSPRILPEFPIQSPDSGWVTVNKRRKGATSYLFLNKEVKLVIHVTYCLKTSDSVENEKFRHSNLTIFCQSLQ